MNGRFAPQAAIPKPLITQVRPLCSRADNDNLPFANFLKLLSYPLSVDRV
jgi:hypothetical protein